ncbi:class I SAM-dependent methyltransferase [Knoellia sp. Soil729]|uniref:class I SAM-dependent methyltransferase n=1 Tax=Knoellia sp. Soil729 TaxID=1736394 RepID=UPI000700206C|nr:class I SAM-dependent methyltransferase [Knoellia sp. Soil729]KRE43558.1 aromatic ring-opening dioxygenase LigA [Knoellia sp. Soil729]
MTDAGGHGGSPSIAQPDYWWYLARTDLLHAALSDFARGRRTVLDIGSADGPSASWLHDGTRQLASLDIDPRGLGANGVCGSALSLPFADASFDMVSAFDVIEHCDPEDEALAEVARVLQPGGAFLMAVPAYQWAWTDFDVANGHFRRYTRRRAVAAVEAAGFRVQRSTYAFTSVFPGFVAERVARRLRDRQHRHAAPADVVDVPHVPRALHHVLMGLTKVDRAVLKRADLPFGSSVFVAATKR